MERDYIVTKSNKLIYASYDLSSNQQKLIMALASMVQPQDTEFQEYTLKIKDFIQLLGITDQSKYKEVPLMTKDLMKKVFEIRNGNEILQLSWLASARYKIHEGVVILKFAPDLKPYLLQLKEFYTSYRLSNVLNLKSKYSIRLYEVLKSNQYKKQKCFDIELIELKRILGADTQAYVLYSNFKSRVLNKSNEELQEKTDIYFDYDEEKEGRKVTGIKFYIHTKNEIAVTLDDKTEKQSVDILKEVCDICEGKIIEREANIIYKLANKNMDLIKEKYYVVKSMTNCRNIPGAIISAIRENWTTNKKPSKWKDYDQRKYNMEELEKMVRGQDYDKSKLYEE